MKRKRFSVEQIVAVLKQAEMGAPRSDPSSGDCRIDVLSVEAALCREEVDELVSQYLNQQLRNPPLS